MVVLQGSCTVEVDGVILTIGFVVLGTLADVMGYLDARYIASSDSWLSVRN